MGTKVNNLITFLSVYFVSWFDVFWTMFAKDLLVALVTFYTRLNSLQALAKL
jgi:hypothetical protein